MTSFFPETGEGWREKATKTPFVLTWGALCKVIISFMKVHSKKRKKPTKRMERQEKKITFPPLPSLYSPVNKRRGGNGWRRTSSGGIPGLFAARQTASRESIQPFFCFSHSLRQQTFDHSTMTRVFPHYMVHLDEKMKRTEARRAEIKTTLFE